MAGIRDDFLIERVVHRLPHSLRQIPINYSTSGEELNNQPTGDCARDDGELSARGPENAVTQLRPAARARPATSLAGDTAGPGGRGEPAAQ